MANHVFTNQTIKHSDPAEIQKLYDLLDRWSDKDDYGLISYLLDEEYKKEDVDRNVMCEAIGAKWMTIEDMYVDENEVVLLTTTAWGQPEELWGNLEEKGFNIMLTEDKIESELFELIKILSKDKSIINRIIEKQKKYSDREVFKKIDKVLEAFL